jgi:hypothetical protein
MHREVLAVLFLQTGNLDLHEFPICYGRILPILPQVNLPRKVLSEKELLRPQPQVCLLAAG